MKNPGLQVATPTDTTIVMTRSFRAPRKLVWDAMTKPELIRKWIFAPPGWTMTVCEGEPRVGGTYRWAWNDEHGKPALAIHGDIREVVEPQRLTHTEVMEMGECGPLGELLATIELSEDGEQTHMRMTLSFASKEARDGALASGMAQGMEAGYGALDGLLATGALPGKPEARARAPRATS
jgi:uncharacterized protein YndB with AHSA1/START domain